MDVEKMCVKDMRCGKAAGPLDNAERAWHVKGIKAKCNRKERGRHAGTELREAEN